MWRNYEEDWERTKTYLIRSLFQDIPLLSPVPEDPELRYDATSPSDVPPSRPHSPLPPLIIERVPNRHDHTEEFYKELEHKMKKLYKKLFYNARSNSIDDLIQEYGGEYEFLSESNPYKEYQVACEVSGMIEGNLPVDNIRPSRPSTSSLSPSENSPREYHDEMAEKSKQSSSERNFEEPGSQGVESSTRSLFATQVTVLADVHVGSHDSEKSAENSDDEVDTIVISPILECKRKISQRVLKGIQEEEEKNCEEESNISNGLTEPGDSGSSHVNQRNQGSLNTTSYKSMELMRRQANISSTLGSIPDVAVNEDSPELSQTYTDVDFQNKMSFEKSDQHEFNEREYTLVESSNMSALCNEEYGTSTSTSMSTNPSRRRNIGENFDQMVTKRKRCENVSIQTSVSYNREDTTNWEILKKSFFIGVPKIYKLCTCNNHFCERND